jgi:predicted PurR-regulated permease PerM
MTISPQSLFERGRDFLSGSTVSSALSVGRSVVKAISLGVVGFIVTIYLVAQPTQLVEGFVSLFPAERRERVQGILDQMYNAVQKWIVGQLAAMLFEGILTAIALSIIGIPYALLFGAISGLLAFIPLVGVLVAIAPPLFLALAVDPILVIWVVLAYIAIHQIEAHVIQPMVMSRAVSLHPVVVVFAILIMGTFFGLAGLVLAVPLVAALKVLLQELWISRMDSIGSDTRPAIHQQSSFLAGLVQRALGVFQRSKSQPEDRE